VRHEEKYKFGTAFRECHFSFKMEGGEEIRYGRKER
jgi:hypothetical protein